MFSRFRALVIVVSFLCEGAHAGESLPAPVTLGADALVFDGNQEFEWTEAKDQSEDPLKIDSSRWTRTKKAPDVRAGVVPVWYKFSFVNGMSARQDFAFHTMGANPSELIWLKVVRQDGSAQTILTGGSVPYASRPVYSMLLVLPFVMEPGEKVTAYLGSLSSYSRGLHFQVRTAHGWKKFENYVMQFEAFYFGMLFVVLLINLMAYAAMRGNVSRAYCIFIASSILVNVVGSGYLNYFGPETYAPPSARMLIFLIPFHLGILGYFTREFLEVRKWSKWGAMYMNTMALLAFLVAALNASGYIGPVTQRLFDMNVFISSIVAMWLGVVALRRNHTPYAWSFLVGFGIYLIGGNIWTLQYRSVIPSTGITRYALFWAQILENIIFTIAVMREARKHLAKVSVAEARQQYGERMATFVKVLTHDLSNYIMIIEGILRGLQRPALDVEQRQKLTDRALKAVNQQKDVLDSVKELKAVEDGKAELKLGLVDLRALLPDLPVTFETRLGAKSIRLETLPGGDGPLWVIADRATLYHSVLCNIVSNAIKFSDSGGVIKISASEKSDGVWLEIQDFGIGMPPELVSKIFSNSENTSRLGTQGEKGTGFGLPIVHAYMSLYGGRVTVESRVKEPGRETHGTRFILKFRKSSSV